MFQELDLEDQKVVVETGRGPAERKKRSNSCRIGEGLLVLCDNRFTPTLVDNHVHTA